MHGPGGGRRILKQITDANPSTKTFEKNSHKLAPDRLSVEERNARIREQYSEGRTRKELAGEFGISQGHVGRICKGVERRKK